MMSLWPIIRPPPWLRQWLAIAWEERAGISVFARSRSTSSDAIHTSPTFWVEIDAWVRLASLGLEAADLDAASDEAATELPPGYSRITDAIREIMELDEETYSNLLRQGAIVAPGHVLRFASDERESWDYFIAMEREMFAVISPLTKSG